MPGYSLIPVDYQPDFEGYSLIPVDYDPFAEDGAAQQAQPQRPPRQQPATGAGQPDTGALAAGGGPSGSEGGGIGLTGGAPNPTLDQGAAKAVRLGGYSLIPVDYQPNFDRYSLIPVDYDPFAADAAIQQAQFQQPPSPTQPAPPQPQQESASPASTGRRTATASADRVAAASARLGVPPTRRWIKAQPKLLPWAATLGCRWAISRISMATIRSPRMA